VTTISTRQVLTGLLSSSAAAWVRQASTLVLYIMAARLLAPDEIGVFALASALVLALEYGVFDAVSETVVQRAVLEDGHMGAAIGMATTVAALCTVIGLLASAPLATLFSVPQLAHVLPWMIGSVALLCVASAHVGTLRRQARFHLISLLQVVGAVSGCAIGVVLMLLGWGIWSLVAYFLTEKVVYAAGALICAIRQPVGRFSRRHVAELYGYCAAIGGQRIAFFLRNQMDRLLIAWLWGPDVLGAYQLAARIFESVGSTLLAPASKLFFVTYTRLQGNPVQLRTNFLRSLEGLAFVAFPAFVGLAAVAPQAVHVLFGKTWGQSELLLQLLSLGGIPLALNVMSGTAISATGRAKLYLVVEMAAAVIGAVLLATMAVFGILGIALALLVRESLVAATYAVLLRACLGIRIRSFVGALAQCLAVSLAMGGFVILCLSKVVPAMPAPLMLAVGIALGAIFYGAIMSATRWQQISQTVATLRGSRTAFPVE
jgi:O-antigen/teichoic acid export membrane protein